MFTQVSHRVFHSNRVKCVLDGRVSFADVCNVTDGTVPLAPCVVSGHPQSEQELRKEVARTATRRDRQEVERTLWPLEALVMPREFTEIAVLRMGSGCSRCNSRCRP